MSPNSMLNECYKWIQTTKISISNQLAYKLNLCLYVIAPPVIFLFIKYNLWTAIFSQEGNSQVGGYTLSTMLEYQMWVLIISLFAQSYRGINLSEDIRFGRISTYLVYPFDFWKYHTAAFFGHQIIQLFVAALSLVILWAVSPVPLGSPSDWLIGLTYALFVSIFMFVLQFLCGLSAFWLEETWMFRILLSLIAQFCSGAIVPLELFPDIFRNVLNFTPFPYLTYIPVKLCMGTFTGSLPFMMFVLAMWMVIAVVATIVLWRLGLKNYTGAGM